MPARFALSLRSVLQARRRIPPNTMTKAAPAPMRNQIASKIRIATTPMRRIAIATAASLNPYLATAASLRARRAFLQAVVETAHDTAAMGALATRVHPAGRRGVQLRLLRRGRRLDRPRRLAARSSGRRRDR